MGERDECCVGRGSQRQILWGGGDFLDCENSINENLSRQCPWHILLVKHSILSSLLGVLLMYALVYRPMPELLPLSLPPLPPPVTSFSLVVVVVFADAAESSVGNGGGCRESKAWARTFIEEKRDRWGLHTRARTHTPLHTLY